MSFAPPFHLSTRARPTEDLLNSPHHLQEMGGEADKAPAQAEEEATGKVESKSEAKKDFVPSVGLTTARERPV